MATAVPRERLRQENMNFVPAKSMGKIPRYAGGGHGAGAVVSMEEVPIIPADQLAEMEKEQIMAGMEQFASRDPRYGSTGFSGYFRESAAKSEMPADMADALAAADAEGEVEFSQQERRPEERDQDHGMDDGHQGESPASGHSPVVSGKFGYKQKVYIASLDVLGSVYEDNGSTVTVKTVHGKWIDISKKDVQAINTADVASDGELPLEPRKRDQGDDNSGIRDHDQDSMSSFSEKKSSQGESYAERRRARRSEA